jgi:hypothetical protein
METACGTEMARESRENHKGHMDEAGGPRAVSPPQPARREIIPVEIVPDEKNKQPGAAERPESSGTVFPQKQYNIRDVLAWVNETPPESAAMNEYGEHNGDYPAAEHALHNVPHEEDISIEIGSINLTLENTEQVNQAPAAEKKQPAASREARDPFFWQRHYLRPY